LLDDGDATPAEFELLKILTSGDFGILDNSKKGEYFYLYALSGLKKEHGFT